MKIVINHVTRMKAPRICVAGFDPLRLEHVRPTTPQEHPLEREMLREEGGAFGMGAVVELGDVVPTPSPPETEDHRFRATDARRIDDMGDDEFLVLLERMSSPSLADAFGPSLTRVGSWRFASERGSGESSLAVIKAGRRMKLTVDDRFGRLQLRFVDRDQLAYVAVNDIRFYESDHATIRKGVVEDVSRRLQAGVSAHLMFGLTRPYEAPHDDRERHWLQLNGLCLADRPVSDVP